MHLQAADLCHGARSWWSAEDDRGIPAEDMIRMRLPLWRRLLSHVDFAQFLSMPPGMFIKDWPTQLWEALVGK